MTKLKSKIFLTLSVALGLYSQASAEPNAPELQRALNILGADVGLIDGVVGARTRAAISSLEVNAAQEDVSTQIVEMLRDRGVLLDDQSRPIGWESEFFSIYQNTEQWGYGRRTISGFPINNFDMLPIENRMQMDLVCDQGANNYSERAICRREFVRLFWDFNHPAVGDFNGDDISDVVITFKPREEVWEVFNISTWNEILPIGSPLPPKGYVFYGNAEGSFNVRAISGALGDHFGFYRSVVADLNGDGIDDIFATDGSTLSSTRLRPHLYLGSADGLVDVSSSLNGQDGRGHTISMGDIDNDGDIDVIIPHVQGRGEITIFRNNQGTFASERRRIGLRAFAATIGDIDGDGNAEFVAIGSRINDERNINFLYQFDAQTLEIERSIELPEIVIGNSAAFFDAGGGEKFVILAATSRGPNNSKDPPYYERTFLYSYDGDTLNRISTQEEVQHGEGQIYVFDHDRDGTLDFLLNNGWHGDKSLFTYRDGEFHQRKLPELSPNDLETDLPLRSSDTFSHFYVPLESGPEEFFGILQFDPNRITLCDRAYYLAGFRVLDRRPELFQSQQCDPEIEVIDRIIFFSLG